jgi:hypothetical protein
MAHSSDARLMLRVALTYGSACRRAGGANPIPAGLVVHSN